MQGIDKAQQDLAKMRQPWRVTLGQLEKPKVKSGKGVAKHYSQEDKSMATCMVQNQLSRLASSYSEVETYRTAIEDNENKTKMLLH